MDDVTLTTTPVQARWMLTALERTVTIAKKRLKVKQSRSLVNHAN